jgi:hypothetical protein
MEALRRTSRTENSDDSDDVNSQMNMYSTQFHRTLYNFYEVLIVGRAHTVNPFLSLAM